VSSSLGGDGLVEAWPALILHEAPDGEESYQYGGRRGNQKVELGWGAMTEATKLEMKIDSIPVLIFNADGYTRESSFLYQNGFVIQTTMYLS
jgi:hypothetical protein